MDIDIHKVYEHYEVYIQGKFYCSTDTLTEAIEEIEQYSKTI